MSSHHKQKKLFYSISKVDKQSKFIFTTNSLALEYFHWNFMTLFALCFYCYSVDVHLCVSKIVRVLNKWFHYDGFKFFFLKSRVSQPKRVDDELKLMQMIICRCLREYSLGGKDSRRQRWGELFLTIRGCFFIVNYS